MVEFLSDIYAPFTIYSAEEWSNFRADIPVTLDESDLENLRSIGDPIDLQEVEKIYLSLSRLLFTHFSALQVIFRERQNFLQKDSLCKTPFIIGIAGSVAVGKSTTARILQELLKGWPIKPKVSLVTTDGFLYSNKKLQEKGKMRRKGFPDSYDRVALLRFLSSIKAGKPFVRAPVYSHFFYDILEGEYQIIDRPDILIFEGINVLQSWPLPQDKKNVIFVSDFFDFSIYIDARPSCIKSWYKERFMRLRATAFQDPSSYFHNYASLTDEEALEKADDLWENINLKNLKENIAPSKPRADLILHKGSGHFVEYIALRNL